MPDAEVFPSDAFISLPELKARFATASSGDAINAYCREQELDRLLLIGSPAASTRFEPVWSALESRAAAVFFKAQGHCPEATVEDCRQTYRGNDCQACIVIGGGSALGLGKILRAEEGAHFIAVPTTYSGSEATAIYGRKSGGEKRTQVDSMCRPDLIIYDAELSEQLPGYITITSAMNSIAHAVEALYPATPNPLAAALAKECLVTHRRGFEKLGSRDNLAGRKLLLYAGFLGGLVVGMTGIALHHRLCHVLGGLFGLPHAESNAIVLPHVVAFNGTATPTAMQVLADCFDDDDPAGALYDFCQRHGGPSSLRSIGMPEQGIDAVADNVTQHGGYNPRALERSSVRQLVQNAFLGNRPEQEYAA